MSDELLYSHSATVEVEPESISSYDEMLPSSRVPHIGHAVVFVLFAGLLLLLTQLIFSSVAQTSVDAVKAQVHPKDQLATMAITYIATLASCFLIFPLFWDRNFLSGVQWHGRHALRLSVRLISVGLCVGWTVQAISSLIPVPKSMPMDDFFRTPSDVWLVAGFGTLLAPLFEEITFRGFLLPAFTIAFEWLGPMLRYVASSSLARLKRVEPERHIVFFRESASAGLTEDTGNLYFRSRTAVILASIVTSVLFALIHADQLAHAWGAVGILFCVSLILTLIRVQTRSVACSTIVHASYNLSVFITLFLGTSGFRHLDKLAH
jgi:membrane protease YdiL (CAAX protease family)